MVGAARWYHSTKLPDRLTYKDGPECQGFTPKQMQDANKHNWRGGVRGHRFQRWSEWQLLMKQLDAKQQAMSKEQGGSVGVVAAAELMDRERCQLCLSLTQYVKHLRKEAAQPQDQQQQEQQDDV